MTLLCIIVTAYLVEMRLSSHNEFCGIEFGMILLLEGFVCVCGFLLSSFSAGVILSLHSSYDYF